MPRQKLACAIVLCFLTDLLWLAFHCYLLPVPCSFFFHLMVAASKLGGEDLRSLTTALLLPLTTSGDADLSKQVQETAANGGREEMKT